MPGLTLYTNCEWFCSHYTELWQLNWAAGFAVVETVISCSLSLRRRLLTGPTGIFSGRRSSCVLVSLWNLRRSPPRLASRLSSSGAADRLKHRRMPPRQLWVCCGEWDHRWGISENTLNRLRTKRLSHLCHCPHWLCRWHQVLLQRSRSLEDFSCCTLHIPQSFWSSPVPQTLRWRPQVKVQIRSTTSTLMRKEWRVFYDNVVIRLFHIIQMFPLLFRPPSSRTVSYMERQKDATYITVSSRPTPESKPGARVVKSMSLRAAIAKGQIVRLEESNKTGEPVKPGAFEVNKFFRRLSFKHQVRSQTGLLTDCVQWHARSVWWITLND